MEISRIILNRFTDFFKLESKNKECPKLCQRGFLIVGQRHSEYVAKLKQLNLLLYWILSSLKILDVLVLTLVNDQLWRKLLGTNKKYGSSFLLLPKYHLNNNQKSEAKALFPFSLILITTRLTTLSRKSSKYLFLETLKL